MVNRRLYVPALATLLALATWHPAIAKPAVAYWTGDSAGALIRWSAADLLITQPGQSAPLFSAKATTDKDLGGNQNDCSADASYQLLSVVGPIVSYERDAGGYCKGAAHPWADRGFLTLDTRTGKPVRLTDLFPEKQVLAALLGDRLVQKGLTGKSRPQTLKAFFETLEDYSEENCIYGFQEDMLQSFAFHHLKGDQVAVRIALKPTCEVARGMLTQLGVYLPIPTTLASALREAAAKRHGLLMDAAPKGETVFKYGDMDSVLPSR
jgi:hypothetical protein